MKCENCYYYQLAQKWVNTPFKLGGTSLKGIDCFGVSLRIVQESGLISEDQFRVIHTTSALRILRKEGVHKFKAFIQEESGGRLVETTDPADLKCGDWVLRIIGRNFDVESALFVGGQFITSFPKECVTITPVFKFDFAITWGGFSFREWQSLQL